MPTPKELTLADIREKISQHEDDGVELGYYQLKAGGGCCPVTGRVLERGGVIISRIEHDGEYVSKFGSDKYKKIDKPATFGRQITSENKDEIRNEGGDNSEVELKQDANGAYIVEGLTLEDIQEMNARELKEWTAKMGFPFPDEVNTKNERFEWVEENCVFA